MENKRMSWEVPVLYDALGKTRYLDIDIIIHLCVDIVWMSPPWLDVGQCWAVAWLQWPHTEHSSTASISSGPLSRGGGSTQSPPTARPECYYFTTYQPQKLFCIRSSSLATHCEHTLSEPSSQASETSDWPGNLLGTLVQWRPRFWT